MNEDTIKEHEARIEALENETRELKELVSQLQGQLSEVAHNATASIQDLNRYGRTNR